MNVEVVLGLDGLYAMKVYRSGDTKRYLLNLNDEPSVEHVIESVEHALASMGLVPVEWFFTYDPVMADGDWPLVTAELVTSRQRV